MSSLSASLSAWNQLSKHALRLQEGVDPGVCILELLGSEVAVPAAANCYQFIGNSRLTESLMKANQLGVRNGGVGISLNRDHWRIIFSDISYRRNLPGNAECIPLASHPRQCRSQQIRSLNKICDV